MFKSLFILSPLLLLAACTGVTSPGPAQSQEAAMQATMQAAMHAELTTLAAQAGELSDLLSPAALSTRTPSRQQFLRGRENTERDEITLPVYRGRRGTQDYWFVITEASDPWVARLLGVNHAPMLRNARGTAAVQQGTLKQGVLQVPASVDFSPVRVVTPGPGGFPPAALVPGAVGQAGYSPLIELPGGIVLNASHIANSSGLHDKLVSWTPGSHRATFKESEGFYDDEKVYYVSLDASASDAAALEAVTLAPALNTAPGLNGGDGSARSNLALFINGQTGTSNPERQGLTSALLGEGDALNALASFPPEAEYTPLWNVHATVWTDAAVRAGLNKHQTSFEAVAALGARGTVTAPGGGAWGPAGFIVNCPAVSQERP